MPAFILAVLAAVAAAAAEPPPGERLRDQRDVMVPVTPPAARVVTFNSVLWLYLTLDGGARHIAGASSGMLRIVHSGLLGRIFPGARAIAGTVASDGFFLPNVEAILRLAPDAVFQWSGRNDPAYLQPLEDAGLPVIRLTQTRSDQDFFDTARLAAAVAGKQATAEALVDRYQAHYRTLADDLRAAGAGRGACPKVLYVWKHRPLIPVDGGNFHGRLLARSGGCNAAEDLRRPLPVGLETVFLWNPDVIILYCCDRTRPADLYGDPLWRAVAAVRERRVYKVPSGGSRFADIVEGPLFSRWLAELLHPALPARLRGQVRDTFRDVYGYAMSDAELDETLHMADNRASRGYGRFAAAPETPQ